MFKVWSFKSNNTVCLANLGYVKGLHRSGPHLRHNLELSQYARDWTTEEPAEAYHFVSYLADARLPTAVFTSVVMCLLRRDTYLIANMSEASIQNNIP